MMVKGAVALAKKVAAAAKGAATAAARKRKAAADSSSGSDGAEELMDDSENGTEQGSDDQTTPTDNSRKVKKKKPRKSAVIPRCDFIFVLLSKPKSEPLVFLCRHSLLRRWMLVKVRGNGLLTRATNQLCKDVSCPG